MKKLISMTLLAVAASSLMASQKPIIFATEATYPPFVAMSPSGEMIGFDADLIHAVCKQMQTACELKNEPWDGLIPGLMMHQYDALFGGMAITSQREKVVNFTQSYYQNPVVYVSKKGGDFTVKSIAGKTIGAQSGSQFQIYLQHIYGNTITIKTYASNMTALLDLQAGRLDAVLIDGPVAQLWLNKSDHAENFEIASQVTNTDYFGSGNGIAVNKSNPALLAQLNLALDTIKANGTYQELVHHWFGGGSS